MVKKPIPPELIEARPVVTQTLVEHPDMGAPSPPPPRAYTAGLHQQIIENIKRGNRPATAAQMAGITSSTFYVWMKKGKEGDPNLWQFAEDVEIATGMAEGTALAAVNPFDNPDNAKWYLERTRAAGFSKEVNAKVEGALTEFMTRLRDGLPEDVYRMVLSVASGQGLPELEGPARFQLAEKIDDAETE